MRFYIFLIIGLGIGMETFGQVDSPAFEKLLKTTLKGTVPIISVKELASTTEKYVLLDSREPKEYKVSHIRNARNIGFDKLKMELLAKVPKDQAIVIYCSIGARSEIVGEKLLALGYSNVKNLYGSIFEWVNTGQTVYNNEGKPTQNVHAFDKTWGKWLRKGKKVYN
jgi:rhodanese-related sulfurtransferase